VNLREPPVVDRNIYARGIEAADVLATL